MTLLLAETTGVVGLAAMYLARAPAMPQETPMAASLFQRDGIRDLTHKELVVFSDGVQQSPELDLSSSALTLTTLGKTVDKLERQGLVPSLSKVSVGFGGLAAGKGKELSASRIILIRRFWQLYFERSKAGFNPASLDSSVID